MNILFHIVPEWGFLLSLTFCIGCLVFFLWVLPLSSAEALLRNDEFLRKFRIATVGVVLVMFVSNGWSLLLRASEMSGRPLGESLPLLGPVLLKTHFGKVWLTRTASLGVLLLLSSFSPTKGNFKVRNLVMLGCVLIVAATQSASGHASDAGDFSVPEIVDFVHLLATGLWGGGLLMLWAFLLPYATVSPGRAQQLLPGAAYRFSLIAGPAVAAVAGTAVFQGLSYVGPLSMILQSPYGSLVLAKAAFLAFLASLGAFNHFVTVPLLRLSEGTNDHPQRLSDQIASRVFPSLFKERNGYRTALRFRLLVGIEAWLMILTILSAASLRHQTPARHILHQTGSGTGMQHQHHE